MANFQKIEVSTEIFTQILLNSITYHLKTLLNNKNITQHTKNRQFVICHKAAGYPSHMVENISQKVLNSERSLERRKPEEVKCDKPIPIRVVSTYGSDTDLVNTVKKYESDLQKTRSFCESEPNLSTPSTSQVADDQPCGDKRLFQFVKKTGSSLRSRLVKVKNLALGNKHGQTKPCKQRNCATCRSIDGSMHLTVNGQKVKPAPAWIMCLL